MVYAQWLWTQGKSFVVAVHLDKIPAELGQLHGGADGAEKEYGKVEVALADTHP